MEKNVQPIKRCPQLAPLSREHHDGLLFAWKIKQGIEHKASPALMCRYVSWYWKEHIRPHFYQEEKILMPYLPADHAMAKRLKEEHDHIRELIIELGEEPDNRHLVLLCDLVNQHIRFEERELFQYMESLLTPEQLNDVYRQLEEHPLHCHTEWTEEFWVKK